jgi:hypothetical protein
MEFKVGQSLWFAPSARWAGAPRSVVISKVGRKWITLGDEGRMDPETMRMDGEGFSSPGRCYLTRQDWEDAVARRDAWDRVWKMIYNQHSVPAHLTRAAIDKIEMLLTPPNTPQKPA